jgi:hypothetical protein
MALGFSGTNLYGYWRSRKAYYSGAGKGQTDEFAQSAQGVQAKVATKLFTGALGGS